MSRQPTQRKGKPIVIGGIMLIIALLHIVRPGSYLEGQMVILYYSYFSDIALPFGFYFLLCLNESSLPRLKKWFVKSLLVFGAAALAEILQRLGIYALDWCFHGRAGRATGVCPNASFLGSRTGHKRR
jgi:hypothetical protein